MVVSGRGATVLWFLVVRSYCFMVVSGSKELLCYGSTRFPISLLP